MLPPGRRVRPGDEERLRRVHRQQPTQNGGRVREQHVVELLPLANQRRRRRAVLPRRIDGVNSPPPGRQQWRWHLGDQRDRVLAARPVGLESRVQLLPAPQRLGRGLSALGTYPCGRLSVNPLPE